MLSKVWKVLRVLTKPGPASALLRYRIAASIEHQRALAGLDCQTVVDIGANRGQFSLMARYLFPRATIVAFEPLPGPADTFRRVFAQDMNVTLHEVAISSESGQHVMHVSAREDSSSLLPIGSAQSRIFPGTQESGVTVVTTKRLRDAIPSPDWSKPALLKLDVQGFELEALRGCEELLGQFAWIYCECSFLPLYEGQALADEVIAWLRMYHFRLTGVYNMTYDRSGTAVQADCLFAAAR